jgi:hypothetical protein
MLACVITMLQRNELAADLVVALAVRHALPCGSVIPNIIKDAFRTIHRLQQLGDQV